MLQTSCEARLLWRRRKRRNAMEGFCCNKIYSTLMVIGCLTLLPQGLTQNNDDVYIVKPTPALRLGKGELTTVLLVNNDNNHGRYINVRPEVGLLTSTARTFIQEGVTTEYATQVVGTTLDNGRVYAQYLKKSSRVLYDSGVPMPSVVTSWVGEALQSDTDLLPQSHNDLFDADQPDWQAIDDRLLGDRRQKDNFVGNTDYVGARRPANSKENVEISTSLGLGSNIGQFVHTKPAYNFVAQLGSLEENARKVAANKVLPIGDLPTYTIKRNYEPSAFLMANDETADVGNDSGEALARNPKLIYKKLMQNSLKAENASAETSPASRGIAPASRSFATVTYYGFADFTTVVGDSVIVFSPSTSSHNQNYNAHITSIKGEATLGAGAAQGPSISEVPITIAQAVIEPTSTQQSLMETPFERAVSSKDLDQAAEDSSSSQVALTDVEQSVPTTTEHIDSILQVTEVATTSSLSPQTVSSTVMLSRPSDEEILRIYNALLNAKSETMKLEITTTATSTAAASTTATVATSWDSTNVPKDTASAQQETSNVQIFGGATTIFFEDDPFANFVVPSTTIEDLSASTVADNASDTVSASVVDSTRLENSSTATTTISEITTEPALSLDSTTDQPTAVPETSLQADTSNAATTPSPEPHSPTPTAIVPNVVIKEIDPDNADDGMLTDCISTSQVFLTQLPKTVTVLETVIITDASTGDKTEIQQKIQPTFEIKEATKYYCIQPSRVPANREESATQTVAVTEMDELASTEKPKELQNEPEDEIESTPSTSTTTEAMNAFEDDTTPGQATPDLPHEAEDEEEELEASGQPEEEDEDEEEIELIYKTLYTTYTYLTTFFHDDFTSISSHTEVVTNIMTSTLGISSAQEATANVIANLEDNEVNPSVTVNSQQLESTKRFVVPSEVENFIRTDDEKQVENLSLDDSAAVSSTEPLATFYTTYTYYTTIFAEGETEIMSHTEIVTNVKKSAASADQEKIKPTAASAPSQYTASPMDAATTTNENDNKLGSLPASEASATAKPISLMAYGEMAKSPSIPDLGDLSAITLVTDVRSSSSPGNKQIINNFEAKIAQDKFSQQQESVFEDQISSESNTEADEIIPSATLLLQTSFTTFTYYTTMYSGDKTNVISRLETMTNTVTETLQPAKTIDLEGASLPITYFTTFTYWTKLAREGQITTLSREETISNVVLPTAGQQQQETPSSIENLKQEGSSTTAPTQMPTAIATDKASSSELEAGSVLSSTKVVEPTTYYTTYTYYTTSYEADKTITDSRFETVTNIVSDPIKETFAVAENSELLATQTESESVLSSLGGPSQTPSPEVVESTSADLVLYDFKKIIDADGISTIFFTTEIKPTINAAGVATEVISSSSSLFIDEEKRQVQAASATTENPLLSLGADGQPLKHYKTGLVRLIEGTRIANHTTTLYQSKVIGTVIEQRYAQIIESTSSFIFEKTKAATDKPSASLAITPTSSHATEQIQATEQVSIAANRASLVEGSILDNSAELEVETATKPETEQDEESNSKTDEKLRLPFQTKKPPFVTPLKPFSNRSRPQFAPKKNSSATIITRSDFTPTITATPALKTLNRFSSSRRASAGGVSGSNSALFATSSRRFGRPNKSSVAGAAIQASVGGFPGGSRNRLSSSTPARSSFASSSRRLGGGSAATIRPSFSRPSLFSSGYPGNSRARVRASSTVDLAEVAATADISSAAAAVASQEEEILSSQDEAENEEEITTESNRRQNNPLLRLRRPLNRPQGFSPAARAQPNTPNNAVSLRRNPLLSRGRSSNSATSTTTTTTTTSKPKARTFQAPLITQNRIRPTSSLFPPRNIFGLQKPPETTEDNRDASEEETNENSDDSEYEDEDDEESDGEEEDENSRRRRSNVEPPEITKIRQKREADSSQQNRSNFRNRFRRPKFPAAAQSESKNEEDEATETKAEGVTTSVPATTATQRTRSRFGNRYSGHSQSSAATTAATAAPSANHKAIRPTRPSNNSAGRAQFTLREKDSAGMSSNQKGSSFVKRPAFRKPQPGGSLTARRLPSSTSPSAASTSGKRRLKSYTNNDATTSRNTVTGRSRSATTSSGRSRSSTSPRENNVGGRNRGRNNNNYNNNEVLSLDNGGSITVTHVIPAEVTIPVINGKVTEYKQVITAKTSTEVLGPQQYTTFLAGNGLSQLALTREDSSVNYNGATEVTKYVLHETPTTTITFTPTTIRGRKTSFSHVLPSTVYSVEQIVSTVQPQISANAPLANILLSQLLLGNVGLPAANPLLALGGALPGTDAGPAQPATPVTEYKTHISTYVTTLFEGQSTILPVTFQGKKILTTIFDTTAQTITATEFITDTIVTTPTVMAQQQPVVNSLLLQQLLLQQHLQQQQQQLQQPTPDSLSAILNSVPPQFLLGGDNLQELEASNNIRGSGHSGLPNDDVDFASGSSADLDDIALQAQAQTHKSGRKKTRKNGKSHKRKNNNNNDAHHLAESSVITLYVSGRRPGEFSTVLSTVQVRPDSTQYKRHVHEIDTPNDYLNEGSEAFEEYLPLPPPDIVLLDKQNLERDNFEYGHIESEMAAATQSLESIVGDVSLWLATQSPATKTNALKWPQSSKETLLTREGLQSKLADPLQATKQHFFA